MKRQLDQQKLVPIISKQPGPAECAKRSAAPACRARRAGFSFAACLCCLVACLGLSVPVFLVLAVFVPLLKSSPPAPAFRQDYHLNALGRPFFRIFFWTSFFIDFVSVLASILPPKIDPRPDKIGKNGSSNPSPFFLQFFCRFSSKFGRSSKGRTLDFARPYGTLATFLHFHLSAVGSPLASILDS